MAQRRVELGAPLAGHWLVIDDEAVTLGFLEDMQSQDARLILNALASCIVDGDLEHGCDRAGLRRLSFQELKPIVKGVMSAVAEVPKSGGA